MCELIFFFSHFFREWSFKSRQNPRVDFFTQEKTLKDSKQRFSIYCNWVLWSMDCLQLLFIHVEEAVSWTQHLTRKIWPKNRSLSMTNKIESKCFQKIYVSVNRIKNATWRQYLNSRNWAAIFVSTSCEEQHNKHFWLYKLGESTENNKALLFFSGNRKQFKLLSVPLKPLRCSLGSDKLVNCHVWKFNKDLF